MLVRDQHLGRGEHDAGHQTEHQRDRSDISVRLLREHAKKAVKEEKAFLRSIRAEAKAKEDSEIEMIHRASQWSRDLDKDVLYLPHRVGRKLHVLKIDNGFAAARLDDDGGHGGLRSLEERGRLISVDFFLKGDYARMEKERYAAVGGDAGTKDGETHKSGKIKEILSGRLAVRKEAFDIESGDVRQPGVYWVQAVEEDGDWVRHQARPRANVRQHRTRARAGLSMIIPPAEWGYVVEEYDDFPDYVPNMGAFGESKPGDTPEAYPADSLDLEAFWNRGAEAVDFHDIPSVDRPCYVEMKQFIDNEGLTMLPSETELLERDIQMERRARAKARKERFADEPDEDLVDDTLDDVPLGTLDDEIEVGVIDVPPPPVDFDDTDGYDDGYDSDPGIAGGDSDGMY
eukprot:g8743.t1